MLKKIITLSIVAVVVLIGVENLVAQEGTDRPKADPGQEQVLEGQQRQRDRAQQFRRRRADSEVESTPAEAMRKRRQQEALQALQRKWQQEAAKNAEALRKERQQEAAKKIEAIQKKRQQEALKKKRQQEAAKKGAPRGRMSREPQQPRPGQNLPMQQMFGRWNRGWQGRGMGRWGRGFQGRGIGRWGQGRGMTGGWGRGFQGRGMGRLDPDMQPFPDVRPFPPKSPEDEDVLIPMPPMQRRGMGRPGPGMPPRPDVARPDPPMPPQDEDIVRPMPPMRRRGMDRGVRDLPEPNVPEPRPRRQRSENN